MSHPLGKAFFRRLNLLALISTMLFSTLLVHAGRTILLNDLKDKGESIARILAAVTLDAVLVHNYATVERYVEDIAKGTAVLAVEVKRSDGELLASHGVLDSSRGLLLISQPVMLGGDSAGEVRIGLSTDRIDGLSRLLLLYAAGAVILFHLLGLAFSSIALKKAVLRPLAALKQAITTVQQGDFHQTISIDRPDEFAEIGEAFNGMARTIRSSFADIRSQQEALSLERSKLAAIVGSMADGLFVTDNDGIIISFNRSATHITGYSEEEARGRRCADLFRTSLCKEACALNFGGETIVNRESSMRSRDGRLLAVSVSSAMLFDGDGEVVGGVQTFRDITEEKRQREFLRHTEKLAAIGQLAAGVAHEINNPLSNILGYARYLKPDTPPDELARKVEVIIEQTRKCSAIVRGLLDFSRASDCEPSSFALASLIDRVAEMVRFRSEKRKITILREHGEAAPVFADPRKIEQVVLNLLMNAVQAVADGGTVWLTSGMVGTRAFFSVADNGPGVPESLLYKIFEPFYTSKPAGEGTGLGLSICAGIVAEAGGSIDVEDRPSGGALFTVLLPTAKEAE